MSGRDVRVLTAAVVVTAMTAFMAPVAADAGYNAATREALETLERVRAVRSGEARGDLTLLLRDLWLQRDALPAAQYAQATDEFGRPSLPDVLDTPGGSFRIHYDNDPASPDHTTDAFAAETGQVFEEVLADQVGRQGWRRPADDAPRGGDARIDVYLTDLGAQGIFGFAAFDADADCDPTRCTDAHGWMGMDNDYEGYGPPPGDSLRATTAHEFHHLIQYAEAALLDGWFFEATATWQESVVYPDADARTFYIPAYSDQPHSPLTTVDGSHEYGMYVFMRFLADRFGPEVIVEAWRAALDAGQHSLSGLDIALTARGTSFDRVFSEFTAAAAAWNAGGFPRDEIASGVVTYPELVRIGALTDGQGTDVVLDHTSAALYSVAGADRMGARITVPGDVRGAVAVVASGAGGVRAAVSPIDGGTATASLVSTAGEELTVLVINADPTAGPPGAPGEPFDYIHDQVPFTLTVGSDIVGDDSGPGPVTPGEPQDALIDGGRVAGGDPVAQAIATSQAIFPDGAATRVVLATSENFPDALAGAGLAGAEGPILFTPFGDALDARVAAEITRVTGGDAVVLTLGGVAAVTDGAAAQARAAAGDRACGAPFPADCRYAGTGREHTAALIADTVQAEVGQPLALIARGNDFADALTGGAFAARYGVALLLTPSDQPNTSTAAWLEAHPEVTDVIVLGGTAAVDDATAAALGATDRIAGGERTETSVAIARDLWSLGDSGGSGGAILVNVRAADGWQTALSAAVASAAFDAPQLGVETGQPLTAPVAAHLRDVVAGPVQAFGSTGLVSDAQLQEALAHRG